MKLYYQHSSYKDQELYQAFPSWAQKFILTLQKVHCVVFNQKRKIFTDWTNCLCFKVWMNWPNKLTLLTFILFHCVYIWWTPPPFLAPNSVLGASCSSENSLLIQLWSCCYYLIIILNIIYSPTLHSGPLKWFDWKSSHKVKSLCDEVCVWPLGKPHVHENLAPVSHTLGTWNPTVSIPSTQFNLRMWSCMKVPLT